MHPRCLTTALAFVVLAFLPAGAPAQEWGTPGPDPYERRRVDVSASAGLVLPTDWSDVVLLGAISAGTGVFEQVLVRDLRVDPSSDLGLAVTYWRGKYGFRTQVGRSRSSLLIGGDSATAVDVNTWSYDVRGAIGAVEYEPGLWLWPYVSFGFGGITYDLARTISPPLLTFIEGRPTPPEPPTIVIVERGRQFVVAIDELGTETVFALNFGVGTDFRIPLGPGGVGLRLEVTDHIARSPLGVRIQELGAAGLGSARAVDFGWVHHLRAAAGFVVQIGR